jgi:hypothetical protein
MSANVGPEPGDAGDLGQDLGPPPGQRSGIGCVDH